jgi:hypothetical protein
MAKNWAGATTRRRNAARFTLLDRAQEKSAPARSTTRERQNR